MLRLSKFLRDRSAASAAEFALILPIAILFLLGLIDVGRYSWAFNRAEKATQEGARLAVVTNPVPSGLASYSFATSGEVPQGEPVPEGLFPDIVCRSNGTTATCTCTGCSAGLVGTPDSASFNAIADRMIRIWPSLRRQNIEISYRWSGLGYSGDPRSPDVSPLITVRLRNHNAQAQTDTALRYPMWFLLGGTVPLPDARYSLTAEDLETN